MPDLIVPTLDISDVSVYYGHKCAVENVSFNAHSGHIYAIIGNNGCGKTSLMKAVMNLTGHNGICRLNGKTLEKNVSKKKSPVNKLYTAENRNKYKYDSKRSMSFRI